MGALPLLRDRFCNLSFSINGSTNDNCKQQQHKNGNETKPISEWRTNVFDLQGVYCTMQLTMCYNYQRGLWS